MNRVELLAGAAAGGLVGLALSIAGLAYTAYRWRDH